MPKRETFSDRKAPPLPKDTKRILDLALSYYRTTRVPGSEYLCLDNLFTGEVAERLIPASDGAFRCASLFEAYKVNGHVFVAKATIYGRRYCGRQDEYSVHIEVAHMDGSEPTLPILPGEWLYYSPKTKFFRG